MADTAAWSEVQEAMALIKINWRPGRKQLRSYGFFGLAVFGLLTLSVYVKHTLWGVALSSSAAHAWAVGFAATATLHGLLAIAAPLALRPAYLALSIVTFPIGFVLSQVIMGVLFFGVFAPVGLIARLLGWDPMRQSFDRAAKSYWIRRKGQVHPQRYLRQY